MKHSIEARRLMVDSSHQKLSISEQCRLLSLHRSGLYYKPCGESEENLKLMQLIDRIFLDLPFTGTRKMKHYLQLEHDCKVNRKRLRRLYLLLGLQTLTPQPKTTIPGKGHQVYPYLLRNLVIEKPNQVWATDITYIPMRKGFLYLIAIIDLHSRYVLNWSLSNTMDADWCAEVLREAIDRHGCPQIFNTDQGSQFTSDAFTGVLKENKIKISMDGKGRATDNIFIERLWRSLKYEYVYLNPSTDGVELYNGLARYFEFYNNRRVHQSLDYSVPLNVYRSAA
jgi:putative transposase